MNIWRWVGEKRAELLKNGHDQLADLIENISSDTCSGNHDAVDRYAEEAIQLARDINEPWVEIFLRHWRLQSAVLRREKPKEMVREAVELLEFSHNSEYKFALKHWTGYHRAGRVLLVYLPNMYTRYVTVATTNKR